MNGRSESAADDGPYSPQYNTVVGVGHTRPTQEVGAPTLVWHVAVWPAGRLDPQNIAPETSDPDFETSGRSRSEDATLYDKAIQGHNRLRRELMISATEPRVGKIDTVNALLSHLQKLGRTKARLDGEHHTFTLGSATESEATHTKLEFITPESIAFTLWWRDRIKGKSDQRATERPGYAPLRVRVQVEAQIDYCAFTFLIDVGNPWNAGQIFSAADAPGERRKKIFEYIEQVRSLCEAEFTKSNSSLEQPLVPLDRVAPAAATVSADLLDSAIREFGEKVMAESVPTTETEFLLKATKYLYARIWNEFCEDFQFKFEDISGTRGRVFANFRGVILSTPGTDPVAPGTNYAAAANKSTATPGKEPFRKFGENFKTEPNAVVKAYWPLVRRVKPFADYREYIACGVLNWRALYITALGSQSEYYVGDESTGRAYEVPSLNLPELPDKDGKVWLRKLGAAALDDDPLLGPKEEEPVRYLLLTKYEPHRRQLGRIVDRINALGTMRLFALKSWAEIYEASEHIRMRGQQLDQVTAKWIRNRQEIDDIEKRDDRNSRLSILNENVEGQLIGIVAELDKLAPHVVGGLPYRLARSSYYVDRFNRMRETLGVGDIESWTSYNQFASRGLQPVFDFIKGVGHRLAALRQRLAAVMQSIQTSALVSQSEETRRNTRELELLQRSANGLGSVALVGILLAALQPLREFSGFIDEYCASNTTPFCELTKEIFGAGEKMSTKIYGALLAVWITLSVLGCIYVALRRVKFAVFMAVVFVLALLVASVAWFGPAWIPPGRLKELTQAVSVTVAATSAVVGLVTVVTWAIAEMLRFGHRRISKFIRWLRQKR